jgi:hypothetical protein
MRPEEGQMLGKANNEQMRTNPIDDSQNHPPRIFVLFPGGRMLVAVVSTTDERG